jgi:hypothetical protein
MREESLVQRVRWWGRLARPHHDEEPLAYEAFVAVKVLIENRCLNLWGADEQGDRCEQEQPSRPAN